MNKLYLLVEVENHLYEASKELTRLNTEFPSEETQSLLTQVETLQNQLKDYISEQESV